MRTLLLTAVLFITTHLGHSDSEYYYETDIYNETYYVQHQDIYRAFKDISDFYWLFGFNYHSKHTENKSCVYFDVENITQSAMNWSSNFIRYGQREKINYTGEFYSTKFKNMSLDQGRQVYNSLYARLRETGKWPMNYTLIYSDYQNCSVFRVLQIDGGYGCMVLLTNSTAYTGMPEECQRVFNDTCTLCNHTTFEQVFNNSCHRTPEGELIFKNEQFSSC
uniref:Putative lipocal-1 1 n=1 Tax=Amblyomma cajennense TaxID=34607 RepID=A0A023FR42_AMBCJ